jgi:hypothetical protein
MPTRESAVRPRRDDDDDVLAVNQVVGRMRMIEAQRGGSPLWSRTPLLSASWPGPSWPCMSLDRYTQSTLNVAPHFHQSRELTPAAQTMDFESH